MTTSMLPAPPLRDVLDDEHVLARADVAERAGLAQEDGRRGRPAHPPPERRLLLLELLDGGEPDRPLRARVEVVVQRPVVEKADEQERSDGEPATCHRSSDAPAA